MAVPEDFDIVIIGAGPAGSTAAIAYKRASADLRIALVDKSTFPRDKACGDGLGPGVLPLLEDLGVAETASGGKRVSRTPLPSPAPG